MVLFTLTFTDAKYDPLGWHYDGETSTDSDLLIVPMSSEGNSIVLIPNRKNGGDKYPCSECGRCYKLKSSLFNHRKYECGKEPQFQCPVCEYTARQKGNFKEHMSRKHPQYYYSNRETLGF